jgi:hypothetical protein
MNCGSCGILRSCNDRYPRPFATFCSGTKSLNFDQLGPRTKPPRVAKPCDAKVRYDPDDAKSAPLSQNDFCVRATHCASSFLTFVSTSLGPPAREHSLEGGGGGPI